MVINFENDHKKSYFTTLDLWSIQTHKKCHQDHRKEQYIFTNNLIAYIMKTRKGANRLTVSLFRKKA